MRHLVALALTLALAPAAAYAQACDSETFSNGACDCGCGTNDPECPASMDFSACESNYCPTGQVPEKLSPKSCRPTACGDGWRDQRLDEACDDGDTADTGGCNATCEAVSPGYVCGVRGAGCGLDPNAEVPVDAGTPSDAGTGGGGGAAGGGGGTTGGGGGATGGGGGGATGGGGGATGGGGFTGNPKAPPSSEPLNTGCGVGGGAVLAIAALALLRRRQG